jgi:hypothetical protein
MLMMMMMMAVAFIMRFGRLIIICCRLQVSLDLIVWPIGQGKLCLLILAGCRPQALVERNRSCRVLLLDATDRDQGALKLGSWSSTRSADK